MHTHRPSFILALANRVFSDPAEASDWLDRPCVQLGGIPRATCWEARMACAGWRNCCVSSVTISGLVLRKPDLS